MPTVVNAFTDIDRNFGWKVFFQAWFSTILVVITINGFDAGLFSVFEAEGGVAPALRSPLEMIAGGAAFLYILVNAWFVLALVPIPLARGQSSASRMKEVRAHMDLMARGYVWEPDDPLRSLAVLVGLPVALVAISYSGANVHAVTAHRPVGFFCYSSTRAGSAGGRDEDQTIRQSSVADPRSRPHRLWVERARGEERSNSRSPAF